MKKHFENRNRFVDHSKANNQMSCYVESRALVLHVVDRKPGVHVALLVGVHVAVALLHCHCLGSSLAERVSKGS